MTLSQQDKAIDSTDNGEAFNIAFGDASGKEAAVRRNISFSFIKNNKLAVIFVSWWLPRYLSHVVGGLLFSWVLQAAMAAQFIQLHRQISAWSLGMPARDKRPSLTTNHPSSNFCTAIQHFALAWRRPTKPDRQRQPSKRPAKAIQSTFCRPPVRRSATTNQHFCWLRATNYYPELECTVNKPAVGCSNISGEAIS